MTHDEAMNLVGYLSSTIELIAVPLYIQILEFRHALLEGSCEDPLLLKTRAHG